MSLKVITVSPPPTTAGGELLIDGNPKTSKPVFGWAFVEEVMTPPTKSPSNTIAALAGSPKTCVTDVGKSAASAPDVPPAMFCVSPTIFAIDVSASLTDWSVHGIACVDSLSYMSGPAWRR